MHRSAAFAMAALLAAPCLRAETEVRRTGDRVDVRAAAAPVSEVLDRLARETGMKVTYDGVPPRARISVALSRVTPAQAVLSVLEGQGLNYVLRMDATATRVDALLMVSGSPSAAPPGAVGRIGGPRRVDREPDNAEADEENVPAEAPAREAPDEATPAGAPAPAFTPPIGPAVPLSLPAPVPPRPVTGPPTTTPAGPNPQS